MNMAKGKQSPIVYRDHEIKEDHSFTQGPGMMPGKHKRYHAKVGGRTVKGSLEEVKARIDHSLDNNKEDAAK